ncbi:MAG: hypothetical protein IPL34_20345 [Thiofilum sp.]|uniref:hypothetical protein n=1 Tax=Thiofilum sp. TaxID=2212733 RepID=UPI0025CC83A4|nr:hypothetical protein [Thiofilum sp.]MBK8455633.1 hypothetical protein [Thiofilum sp.]
MNNELMINEAQAPIELHPNFADMAAEMGITATDIVLPRLLLTQPMSPYLSDGSTGDTVVRTGDIVTNDSYVVVGGVDKPVEVVAFKLWKVWNEYHMVSGEKEYVTSYPVTAMNARQRYQEIMADGTEVIRDFVMNYFVVERSKLGFVATPSLVSFKRTSINAGKAIATMLQSSMVFGKAPWSKSIKLSSSIIKDGNRTYAVLVAKPGTNLTDEEMAAANKMYGIVKSLELAKIAAEETSSVSLDNDRNLSNGARTVSFAPSDADVI